MPTGTERFAAVPAERVEILLAAPARPFKQIGIVSALGGAFSSDVAMYKKLRKAAADLGADAVMVTGQSQGINDGSGVPNHYWIGTYCWQYHTDGSLWGVCERKYNLNNNCRYASNNFFIPEESRNRY